ncbi:uncharacterized protein LOC143327162 isoform X2 [Chaetodon auriga]|uniref:uncharacterized protein LOC143327162 isoform X2 n=1 Tax=Chaetodon auriga TaxID=39042 RepID=UPI004032E769
MHNWQENEIKELLTIRGSEAIRNQITGTVKDSVVYNRMTKLLAERGVYRSHMQVISKLKALRKQYIKYHQQKTRCGSDRVDWPFYEQCHRVFGNVPVGNPVKRQRSPTPPPAPSPPSPPLPPQPPAISEEHQGVVVSLWDEVDEREIDKHLGPVEAEDEEEQYSPSEQLQPNNASKFSVHSSIEEEEDDGDGASLYAGVSNSRPTQRDGRVDAGAGGRPATEVDGP